MNSFVALSRITVLGAVGLWGPALHADPVERPSFITPHQPAALKTGARPAAAEGTEGLVSTLQAALDEMAHLRDELAAVQRRNVELEATQAADRTALATLREELERAHAEADALRAEIKLSWRWIDELNMVLEGVQAGRTAPDEALAAARRGNGGETTAAREDAAQSVAAVDPATEDAYVATTAVNLRKLPQNAADVVTVVHEGHGVQVIGRDGNWLQVEYTDPLSRGFTGWVYGRFLSPNGAPENGTDTGSPPHSR